MDQNGYLYAAGSGNSGSDAMIALVTPQGDLSEIRLFDDGASESFHGVGIGPEGVVTAAGQRTDSNGNRFLMILYATGKSP